MKILKVVRPEDTVVVTIMKSRKDNKYYFVNLTHPHICSCSFDTYNDAINDLQNQMSLGNVIKYEEFTLEDQNNDSRKIRRCCQYCDYRHVISRAGDSICICDQGIDITIFRKLFGCPFFEPIS